MKIGGMSRQAPTEQHAENGYQTPRWLVDRIQGDVFGGSIYLDPCTTQANPTGAHRFIAPPDDGILLPWWANGKSVYVNPPYGRTIAKWTEKVLFEVECGASAIMLVPARTCARWFHALLDNADELLLFKGRLQFEGHNINAPFPSALFALRCSLAGVADLGHRVVFQREAA